MERGKEKKKKSSGVDFKGGQACQREGQRCEESPGKREHVGEEHVSCHRNIRRPFKA